MFNDFCEASKQQLKEWLKNLESICDLPHTRNEGGYQCLAYIPRYHYSHTADKCQEVVYGGCGATANNFHTLEDCEKTCGKHKHWKYESYIEYVA